MADEAGNRQAFAIQQFYCEKMAAPIYARLSGAIASGLTRDSRTGARILDWRGEPTRDALPLRLIGGLHALVRAGADSGLADVFAGEVTDESDIAARSTRRWWRMTTRCGRGWTVRRRPTSRAVRAR